jgi:hypothetical protein
MSAVERGGGGNGVTHLPSPQSFILANLWIIHLKTTSSSTFLTAPLLTIRHTNLKFFTYIKNLKPKTMLWVKKNKIFEGTGPKLAVKNDLITIKLQYYTRNFIKKGNLSFCVMAC